MTCCCFFFKQKTAYDMRISDWSSDVCSSDLRAGSYVRGSTSHPNILLMTSTSIGSLRCARARLISPNQKRQYRLSSGSGHLSVGFSPIFFASRTTRRHLLRILLCGGHTSPQSNRPGTAFPCSPPFVSPGG